MPLHYEALCSLHGAQNLDNQRNNESKDNKEHDTRMSSFPQPSQQEKSSTYIWQDRLTDEELKKLQIQDQLVTASMGGVLPEQSDPHVFQHILDVGCGTGNWLLEVAKTYSTATQLIGIDTSTRLIEHASAQAEAQHMSDRVRFRKMDALSFLDFPGNSFDLINQRFGSNFLRTWEWNDLLSQFQRISRPGGVTRIIEADLVESNAPSVIRGEQLVLQALYQSGHYFTSQQGGLTRKLAPLLNQLGFQDIQEQVHTLSSRDETVGRHLLWKYLDHGLQMLQPFLQKWAYKPDDLEELSQQRQREMQQQDFVANVSIHTVWGITPLRKPGFMRR